MDAITFHQAIGTLQSHGYICNSTLTRGFRVEIRPLKREHYCSRITTCGSIQASSSSYQISAYNPLSTPSNGTFEDPSKKSSMIEPQLREGKNVMIAAHGNSLRSIIMYLDKLTSQEVISLELSTGIPMLYIVKEEKYIRRGSPAAPTEARVYAYTKNLAQYRQKLDEMLNDA